MAKKKKPEIFSVTKAVKANARERVGQPKPGRVIGAEPKEEKRARKHRVTLADVLAEKE